MNHRLANRETHARVDVGYWRGGFFDPTGVEFLWHCTLIEQGQPSYLDGGDGDTSPAHVPESVAPFPCSEVLIDLAPHV